MLWIIFQGSSITGIPGQDKEAWVSDINYIANRGRLALCGDHSGPVQPQSGGLETGRSLEAELVVTALENALTMRTRGPRLYFHSDRGSQYNRQAVRKPLECDRSQLKYERLETSGIRLFRWQKASLRIIAYSCPSKRLCLYPPP